MRPCFCRARKTASPSPTSTMTKLAVPGMKRSFSFFKKEWRRSRPSLVRAMVLRTCSGSARAARAATWAGAEVLKGWRDF